MMRHWTIKFQKSENDYSYQDVVAKTMDVAIDWLIEHSEGLARDQVTSVSSCDVAIAE